MFSVAAFVFATTLAFAQAKPNFAGKWTRADAPAAAGAPAGGGGGRGGGGGGFGQEVTITQDANTITFEFVQGGRQGAAGAPQKRVYKLDGSESKNTMSFGGNSVEQVSKAAWDGAKLVITTQGQNGETKQTLSMSGADLQVESTGGRGPSTVTYKKG